MSVELHHRLDGPEGAPVVVLSGSLGTTLDMWDPQVPALARHLRVLRYDHRGHGGSPTPAGPYTIADLGGDLLSLLDDLGLERVSVCGLSLGGMVSMWAAIHAPQRIDRLVVCCSAPWLPSEPWEERAAAVRAGGTDAVAGALAERWFTAAFRAARPEVVDAFVEGLRATPAEGYVACCEAIRDMDLRPGLGAVRSPTLVLAGAEDPATPPDQVQAVADAIPGARFVVLPGASHLANVEQPEAVTAALLGHLTSERPGMQARREVLGEQYVDAAIARTTGFTADFQDLITRYAWGEIWTRPGLDRRMRSAITLTALVAGNHLDELALHVRAARRNGLTVSEIQEILLQSAIYCGVPAANSAFAVAQRVLDEPVEP